MDQKQLCRHERFKREVKKFIDGESTNEIANLYVNREWEKLIDILMKEDEKFCGLIGDILSYQMRCLDEETNKWYMRGADEGSGYCMARVGERFLKQYLIDKNIKNLESAKEWYMDGVNVGSGYAMSRMGRLYEEGCGVEKSEDKAREWYLNGFRAGNGYSLYLYSCNIFSNFYEHDDKKMLQQGVDMGCGGCMTLMSYNTDGEVRLLLEINAILAGHDEGDIPESIETIDECNITISGDTFNHINRFPKIKAGFVKSEEYRNQYIKYLENEISKN